MQKQLEIEKMRLAACGVAAIQNTRITIKDRIKSDSPYWSASYSDVCRAVDREIALREKLELVESALFRRLTHRVESVLLAQIHRLAPHRGG